MIDLGCGCQGHLRIGCQHMRRVGVEAPSSPACVCGFWARVPVCPRKLARDGWPRGQALLAACLQKKTELCWMYARLQNNCQASKSLRRSKNVQPLKTHCCSSPLGTCVLASTTAPLSVCIKITQNGYIQLPSYPEVERCR